MGFKANDLCSIMEMGRIALEHDDLIIIREEILKIVPSVFNAETSNFWMIRPYPIPRIDFNDVVYQGIDHKSIEEYKCHYHKFDPYKRSIGAFNDVVFTLSGDELGSFRKSQYFNEFLKPQNIHHQLAVYFKSGQYNLAVLGIYRSKNEKAFSQQEQNKARLMASCITAGLERAILMKKVRKSEEVINSICPDLPCQGLMVLDEFLEPLYMNDDARKVIATQIAENSEDGFCDCLPSELREKCNELLIDKESHAEKIKQVSVHCANNDFSEPLSANIRHVRSPEGSQIFIVMMGDEKKKHKEVLRSSGLTQREVEVVFLICDGLRNKDIGEKLFISEHTVENHLRSIYEKMSVTNRTSLINKVATLKN